MLCLSFWWPEFASGTSPAGDWVGVYTRTQGETDLDMHIVTQTKGIAATFHFFADPTNPDIPEGCFTMRGQYDASTREIILTPVSWRLQPPDYISVSMTGRLNEAGNIFSGEITNTPGCTTFVLVKDGTLPTRPGACSI